MTMTTENLVNCHCQLSITLGHGVKVVKVKLVKVMYTGLKNEFDFFDFDQGDRVTALQCYSSEWALRVAALQLKT